MRLPWVITILTPLFPLLAAVMARSCSARTAGQAATWGALLALVGASVGAAGWFLNGEAPYVVRWTPLEVESAWALTLRIDLIASLMSVLVAFLGLVVIRFSRQYLSGDIRQAQFFSWMSATLAATLTLVLAGNLLVVCISWIAMSLCLHRLLLHYPERAGAVFAARKKFVISRLGDLLMVGSLVWVHRHYGTWEFDRLFAAAASGNTDPLPVLGFLLAGAAALKSAQFPFHSWLPDTMETPTPVSAFMHAGIVNAGGFLMVRLSPLMVHAPTALASLAILGAVTAAFGAVVMLAQPSVKRALAFSTIAQMGFMLLQCGLGAFGLALLHILAHSLYKAHAFLRAGSTIGAPARAAIPLPSALIGPFLLLAAAVVSTGSLFVHEFLPAHGTSIVFSVILAFALAYGFTRHWAAGGQPHHVLLGLLRVALVGVVTLALHTAIQASFSHLPAPATPLGLELTILTLFGALFCFQVWLWRAGRSPWGRQLYVHALNGFYLGTFANRLLGRLWPQDIKA